MQIKWIAWVAAVVMMTACVYSTSLAEPPQLNIPNEALGSIPDAYLGQIRLRVEYWIKEIQAADTPAAQAAIRANIVADYNKYSSAAYHYEYAKQVAAQAGSVLSKLEGSKAVNLAIAMSQINEVPMQPAFDAMVVHNVSGVRYLGWRGYMGSRLAVMAQGDKFIKNMFDTLTERLAKETDPVVYGPMLGMVRIPPTIGTAITDDTLKAARLRGWSILESVWPTICQRVMAGNAEMARSAREGVTSLEYFNQFVPESKNKVPQMLVDMMYCAAKAYDAAGAEGPAADNQGQLLRDAEGALSRVTGVQKNFVARPLADRNAKDRGAAVVLGVLNWVDELKSKGVAAPKIEAPAASGQTAKTAPAK